MRVLVTGGCGFIGANFIRYVMRRHPSCRITNLDALTYAANQDNLRDIASDSRYRFIHGRIEDADVVSDVMNGSDLIVNFAAESHVDRSIVNAQPFLMTNIVGLQVLIDAARRRGVERFIHISTDEVYGSLETDDGHFTEETPLSPNSPYSASKAAGDLLIRSYVMTYHFPAIVVRPSNNYGPYQFPEKLIPLMITNLIDGKEVPVYGEGMNVRDWLYVEDTCSAIDVIMNKGVTGRIYNVGGESQRRNIEVVRKMLSFMGRGEDAIRFVPDRPGHDYRYSVDFTRLRRELGWSPAVGFDSGIELTLNWYRENEWWWRPLKERLKAESRGFWTEGSKA